MPATASQPNYYVNMNNVDLICIYTFYHMYAVTLEH